MNENIHIHSVQSIFDGAGEPKALVKKAKKMGAEFFALTDHGTMTGIFDAWDQCEKEGIPFIPGVEAYVESDVERPYHFILLAKSMEGYRGISKACTAAETNIDSQGRPVMTKKLLADLFSPNSKYHGEVIATSACILGELGQIILTNSNLDAEVKKATEKMSELPNPEDPKYLKFLEKKEQTDKEAARVEEELKNLKAIAKAPYKKRFSVTEKKMLAAGIDAKAAKDSYATCKIPEGYKADDYDEKLFKEMQASKEAPAKITTLEKQLKELKAAVKSNKEIYDKATAKFGKYETLKAQIDELKSRFKPIEELQNACELQMLVYSHIFGKDNYFVELQYHGMPEEKVCYTALAKIAKKNGIPVVASNDVHMIEKDDVHKRELIRAKRFNKYEDASESDKELYMKTDDELREALLKILPETIVNEAISNISVIGHACKVERKKEGYYPVFPLPNGVTADEEIRRICYENIEKRYPNREGWTEEHEKRLEYELGVICKMGFSDYHLIEQDIVEVAHLLGKVPSEKLSEAPLDKEELRKWCKENDYTVGMGVGIGRGSAAGSLVCYLLGITGLEPLKYGLIFERFLNIERVSMPDIDTDFEPEVRKVLVKYVQHKYGEEYVCGIMTKGTSAAKASIRNCARFLGDKNFGDGKHYMALGDQIAKLIPSKPGITLSDCEEQLNEKFGANKEAMQIINDAKLVEGVYTQVGIHPAGVIISDKDPIAEHMPLMWDSEAGMMKTQCNMIQAEKLGLLKMDFLVLGTLTIITKTLQALKAKKGIEIDLFKVDFEPEVIKNVYADGNTTAVFQFESSGMREMLKKFKPDCIEDIILLNAAYRPGPMDYIPQIIEAKRTGVVEYSIPELEPILGNTYGCIIYQEQVMEIFQKLAGYSLGQADLVRRAMSKKHLDELLLEKEAFLRGDASRNIDGCEKRGINLDAADELFERMTAFASYAFNKSHAGVYTLCSFFTAWLKEHYPAEFLCQAMNEATLAKLPGLIAEAKRYGIKVLPPSLNESEDRFSVVNDKEIRFGLGMVKGVKSEAAEIAAKREAGAFTSIKDFFKRTSVNSGAVTSLIKAGAFDAYTSSRKALLSVVDDIKDAVGKMVKAEEAFNKAKADGKDTSRSETNLDRARKAVDEILIPFGMPDDPDEKLMEEHEVLGTFVSAHPLDNYEEGKDQLGDVEPSYGKSDTRTFVGVVSGLRIVQRKKDGKNMAFFTLEDHTGMIDTACFTDSYAKYGSMLEEGRVVEITGNVNRDYDDIEETETLQLVVGEVKKASRKKGKVVLSIPSVVDWPKLNKCIESAYAADGDELEIYDEELSEFRRFKTPRCVSEKIFTLGLKVQRM